MNSPLESLTVKAERDNKFMRSLKVNEIYHPVFKTDKGWLNLVLRKDGLGKDYFFTLDSVPVDPKQNKELMGIYNGVLFNL